MTRNPTETLVTAVGDWLADAYNAAVAAFNAEVEDGVHLANVTWGDGFGDLTNAMRLPAGDVAMFDVELLDEDGRTMAMGNVDVAIRAPMSGATARRVLTRYADLLWRLVEGSPTLGGRVLLAVLEDVAFGIAAEKRESGFVVATIRVAVELDV